MITIQTTAGAGIVAISTWTYHYYKENVFQKMKRIQWLNKRWKESYHRAYIKRNYFILRRSHVFDNVLTMVASPTSLVVPSADFTRHTPLTVYESHRAVFLPRKVSPAESQLNMHPPRAACELYSRSQYCMRFSRGLQLGSSLPRRWFPRIHYSG